MQEYEFQEGPFYLGTIQDHCVNMTNNGGAQWVASIAADHRMVVQPDGTSAWEKIDGQPTITAYLPLAYTRRKDGAPECGFNIQSLADALGWTPDPARPFSSLESFPAAGKRVQFTCQIDEYQGQLKVKANNVFPEDYEGGTLRRESASTIAQLDEQWGATFRAKFSNLTSKAATPAPTPTQTPASAPTAAPTAAPQASGDAKPYEAYLKKECNVDPSSIQDWSEGLPSLKKKFADAAPDGTKDLAGQWNTMLAEQVATDATDMNLTVRDMGAIAMLIDHGHYPLPF